MLMNPAKNFGYSETLGDIFFWAKMCLGLGNLYKCASLSTYYEDY